MPKSASPQKFVDVVNEGKGFRHHVVLWPKQWRTYTHGSLNWVTTKFAPHALSSIPTSPGLYAFTVETGIDAGLKVALLFYIGKEESSLRSRFADYLKEVASPSGRPRVVYWLHTYRKHVRFSYTTVAKRSRIRRLELSLIDAYIPPANTVFTAKLSRIVRAF
jgi:hypothetical protein